MENQTKNKTNHRRVRLTRLSERRVRARRRRKAQQRMRKEREERTERMRGERERGRRQGTKWMRKKGLERYIKRRNSEDKMSSLYKNVLAIYQMHCLSKPPRVSPRDTNCVVRSIARIFFLAIGCPIFLQNSPKFWRRINPRTPQQGQMSSLQGYHTNFLPLLLFSDDKE